jgi:hypothetical protein
MHTKSLLEYLNRRGKLGILSVHGRIKLKLILEAWVLKE